MQASLDQKQRLQQLFYPDGVAFDGTAFNRIATTASLFKYLAPAESADEGLLSRVGIEPTTRRLKMCRDVKPNGGAVYINQARELFAPVERGEKYERLYIGHLGTRPWFPEPV